MTRLSMLSILMIIIQILITRSCWIIRLSIPLILMSRLIQPLITHTCRMKCLSMPSPLIVTHHSKTALLSSLTKISPLLMIWIILYHPHLPWTLLLSLIQCLIIQTATMKMLTVLSSRLSSSFLAQTMWVQFHHSITSGSVSIKVGEDIKRTNTKHILLILESNVV